MIGLCEEKMGGIKFVTEKETASFINPLKNNHVDHQEIEIRYDPLLGHQSVFNIDLKDKVSILFPETDEEYLKTVVEETRKHCFLCDGRWKDSTPWYPESLIPGGRLIKNQVVLFPNLFPLSRYHAVLMLGDEHYRNLDDFPSSLLSDAISVCIKFMRKCFKADSSTNYFTVNANYLFPAGSSVVHPHLQVIGGRSPTTHQKRLIAQSNRYFKENESTYWEDLSRVEKTIGERWVGEIANSCWITSFSPIGRNEVLGIWPYRRHFLQWDEEDIGSAATGISSVLKAYRDMKCSTFNFSMFSGALDGSDDGMRCMMRIISRQNVVPNHRTDDYYFQKLLKGEIILLPPEELAGMMRKYLGNAI